MEINLLSDNFVLPGSVPMEEDADPGSGSTLQPMGIDKIVYWE